MILDTIKKLADELVQKAELLEEEIGEGGLEVFSQKQLAEKKADMERAFARASLYYNILDKNNYYGTSK